MNKVVSSRKNFSFSSLQTIVESLLILLLPTQLGMHFWPPFSYVLGIRIDYLSPTLYVTDVLIICLCMYMVYKFIKKRKKPIAQLSPILHWSRAHIISVLFFVYALLSFFISTNRLVTGYELVKLIEYLFLTFYIVYTWNAKIVQRVGFLSAISVICESILGIAQYIHQGSLGGLFYFFGERTFTADTPGIANASINGQLVLRPYGTLPHPNVLAAYLLLMLISILYIQAKEQKRLKKAVEVSALIFGAICLMLTLSRITIVLGICLAICYVVFYAKKSTWKKNRLYPILLLSGVTIISFSFSPLFYRFIQTNLTEESFIQRKDLMQNSLIIIFRHPLFGVGLHNFLPSLALMRSPLSPTFYLQPVHNIYLLWIAELGLIGGVFLAIFIYKTLIQLIHLLHQKNQHAQLSIYLFLALLVLGSFDHYFLTLQQGQLLTCYVLGIIWMKQK